MIDPFRPFFFHLVGTVGSCEINYPNISTREHFNFDFNFPDVCSSRHGLHDGVN